MGLIRPPPESFTHENNRVISWDETDAPEDAAAIGAWGGFVEKGMRWQDYLDAINPDLHPCVRFGSEADLSLAPQPGLLRASCGHCRTGCLGIRTNCHRRAIVPSFDKDENLSSPHPERRKLRPACSS